MIFLTFGMKYFITGGLGERKKAEFLYNKRDLWEWDT